MRCDSSVSSSSLLLLHCYLAFLWHSALLPKLPDFVLKSSFLLSFKYIYVWFGSKMKVILGLQLTKTRISMMIFWWNLIIFHCFFGKKTSYFLDNIVQKRLLCGAAKRPGKSFCRKFSMQNCILNAMMCLTYSSLTVWPPSA